MAKNTDTTEAATREVVVTRMFDAPRELVWKAWTEPERFMRWWGPKDFTSPMCEIDLRVGGKFLWCMRWPDGRDNYNCGEYNEIVPPERLVYTTSFSDADGNVVPASYYGLPDDMALEMRVTVTLEDLGGTTKLTVAHAGIPAGEMNELTSAGWSQSLDKLAESLR